VPRAAARIHVTPKSAAWFLNLSPYFSLYFSQIFFAPSENSLMEIEDIRCQADDSSRPKLNSYEVSTFSIQCKSFKLKMRLRVQHILTYTKSVTHSDWKCVLPGKSEKCLWRILWYRLTVWNVVTCIALGVPLPFTFFFICQAMRLMRLNVKYQLKLLSILRYSIFFE